MTKIGNGALRYLGGQFGAPISGPGFVGLDVPAAAVVDVSRMAERGAAPGQSLGYFALAATDAHAGAGTIDVQVNIWTALQAALAIGSTIEPGVHGLWVQRSNVSADVEANYVSSSHALIRNLVPGTSNVRDLIFNSTAVVNFCGVPLLPQLTYPLYTPFGSLWVTRSTAQTGAVNIFHQLLVWVGVLGSTPPGAA